MGSSYLAYRGSGFWVRDTQAELWLYLLAQEAQAVPDAPGWLAHARADWLLQATVGFTGCVSSCLDKRVGTEPGRVAVVIDLSRRALDRLAAWAPAIPRETANSFGTGGDSRFTKDVPVEPCLACGRSFISLLRGELPPGHTGWAL
jgi:hypothetical protein